MLKSVSKNLTKLLNTLFIRILNKSVHFKGSSAYFVRVNSGHNNNIRVVDSKEGQAECVLEIKAKGVAKGATYVPEHTVGPGKFLYTGASVSGELAFKTQNTAITKAFSGSKQSSEKIWGGTIGGGHVFESQEGAPFAMA